MSTDGQDSAAEIESAIQRALDAANLRAGDAPSTSTAAVVVEPEHSAAEAGDTGGIDAE